MTAATQNPLPTATINALVTALEAVTRANARVDEARHQLADVHRGLNEAIRELAGQLGLLPGK